MSRIDGAQAWIKPRTKPFITGGAAALAIALGTGWLTTTGAADNRAEAAVLDVSATICAAQAQAAEDSQTQLVAFNALGSTFREQEFVKAAGWAVMPTADSADVAVIRACAAKLAALAPQS